MSVRVVARIRPLLKLELDKDSIVTAAPAGNETVGSPTVVRIPNPKNEAEHFSFQFNSVYDQEATQQDIYDHEGGPSHGAEEGIRTDIKQLRRPSSISSMASTLPFSHTASRAQARRIPCAVGNH